MEDLGGSSRMYAARIKDFRAAIGFLKNDKLRISSNVGPPPSYEAILGASFLLQDDLEIALATKEIRMFEQSNCEGRSLAYWDPNALELPFLSEAQKGENPAFSLLVNGKTVTAVIASGMPTTVITRSAAQRLGLKLEALAPGRDMINVGSRHAGYWSTRLDSLQLGRETIQNAEIGVVDGKFRNVDLLLGDDFLRSHRVLFAMSQQKLYFSYVGGDPLGLMRGRIPSWVQQEADSGNGDAQMKVANMLGIGSDVPRDVVKADAWVDRAAAAGNPHALLANGTRLLFQGRYADAVAPLRQGLDGLPGERSSALLLYVARMRTGQIELARRELEAAFAHAPDDWPAPIANFYLGKLNEEKLLQLARKDDRLAAMRACMARVLIAEQHAIAGDNARAEALRAGMDDCNPPQLRSF